MTISARSCDPGAVKSISTKASITYALKVATPTLTLASPPQGSVAIGSTIGWQTATSKAPVTFYFTTDGSTPNCLGTGTAGTSYHMVDPAKTSIKVIACSAQMTPSNVATFTYSYFLQQPVITPGTGTYNDYPIITLDNPPSNTINPPDTDFFCATLDGTTPTCNATACGFGSFNIASGVYYVGGSATLKVVACSDDGLPASAVSTAVYTEQVGPIVWSPNPATTYSAPQAVSLNVTPPPSSLGASYVVCTAKGSVSIPPQPNTCFGLGAYLNANTPGVTWSCSTLGTFPATAQAVSMGSIATTTTVSAVACKESMVWSTSQKTYTFNPYSHTIVIDGANEFNAANEALATSGGDTAYLSWDANNIYFGYNGFTFGSGETVDVYFGDGVSGTTTADGAGLPALAHNALYHLVWKNTGSSATVKKWDPTSSTWLTDATVTVNVGFTGGGSTYVEMSIARSAIGSPTVLYMAGGLQNAAGTAYTTVWPSPPNTTASWTAAYFVQLNASTLPKNSAIN